MKYSKIKIPSKQLEKNFIFYLFLKKINGVYKASDINLNLLKNL